MSSRHSGRTFAYEQLVGVDSESTVQQDRVRVDYVKRPSGARILLAVVADGDGHVAAGASAQLVIDLVFETVRQSKDKDLNTVLASGLIAGNQAIKGVGGQVTATVVAIRNHRLHLAHVGHTMGFLIRRGMTRSLTQRDTSLLGTSNSPKIHTNSPKGEMLNAGDQIVLASDGLTRLNPEDGKPFVDPKALPTYMEGNSPREAARHLISIAMGRDVDDNVSVIVIQAPGKTPTSKKIWIPAAILAALILVSAIIVVALNQNRPDEMTEPVDHGYAVVLSGSVFSKLAEGEGKPVEKLGTVPPLAVVEAQEPTRLTLQSSIDSSTEVVLISIYLSSRSKIGIQSVDSYQDLDSEGTRFQSFPTSLTYLDGSILILRTGGVRRLRVEVGEIVVSLAGAGRTIFGIRSSDDTTYVDCLKGGCTYEVETGIITNLQAGQSLMVLQSSNGIIGIDPLSTETFTMWDDLCAGCLSSP